mmetsp:Transcript_21243/g.42409  ORF Transcript_21243/g.42409 Transcript_21243/m.42409 type:complete len:251 (+) Transcript_21243:920-1672(+)
MPRSRRFIWLMKRSRKTPEQETTTSILGRPSSSRGMSSTLLTRPMESGTGRTPARARTWARDSPYVLMLSVPQRVKATLSGYCPSFSAWSLSRSLLQTASAHSTAAVVGMLWGSSACMLAPVGSTSGLRIGSPPGPGRMYSPSRAEVNAPSSLSATTCLRQNSRYLKRGSSLSSTTSGNPASLIASVQGFFFPIIPANIPPTSSKMFLTSLTRPSLSVDCMTRALTAAREASVILWLRSTSSSFPSLAFL